jgi:ubiquinone/menaquinone biosynthesis C-methylase UbiE
MKVATSEHYERLADSYEEVWTHSDDFLAWMTRQTLDRLALRDTDRVADVGGGTGLFTRELAAAANLDEPALCVDPVAAMLDQIPDGHGVRGVQASMEQLAAGEASLPYPTLDAIVLKEAVHHAADPCAVLTGLAGLLRPGGRILAITLPPKLSYPLFSSALERFAVTQPDPDELGDALTAAGLTVEVSEAEFEQRYPTERYLERIRARCMSVLSTFSDAEIEAGVSEIRADHGEAVLRFPDRFAFVWAQRSQR